MSGRFHNAQEGVGFHWEQVGVRYRLGIFPRVQWRFLLSRLRPLTWEGNGGYWQTCNSFYTDGGSVPSVLRPVLPEAQFPASYSMHDCAWRFGGLWFRNYPNEDYVYQPLTRHASNLMLRDWIAAESQGRRAWMRHPIYWGTEIGRIFRP